MHRSRSAHVPSAATLRRGCGPAPGAAGARSRARRRRAAAELGDHPLELGDARRERAHRVGDRVGQVDPVGVGALDAAAVDADRVPGHADDRRVRRHVADDDAVGADLRAVADLDRPEQLRARADRDVVLHRRVALAGLEAGAAERDALVERHVVADRRRLADHDARAVVDEEALADLRGVVDLDPGQRARRVGDRARQHRHAGLVQRVRDAVGEQRLDARPGRERSPPGRRRAPRGRARARPRRRGAAPARRPRCAQPEHAQVAPAALAAAVSGLPRTPRSSAVYGAKNGVEM